MNHGVLFDDGLVRKHSSDDWGLTFMPFEITYPEPKTDYTEIEGGNGTIDLTESYGKIFYKDNSFTMTFSCDDSIRYESVLNQIVSFIHGKRIKIFVYFDEEYYYDARIKVNKYASNKSMGEIVLNVTAYPFKLKKTETISLVDVETSKVVIFKNNRMETVPRFQATSEMIVIFKGNSYAVGTNEVTYPQIEFTYGDNALEIQGTGRLTVIYQEGKF